MKLTGNKKVHFVGIGGAGMSGIADILIEMGHSVTGSDREQSAVTDYLLSRGAKISIGHRAENIGETDFVVFSSAISEENPEIRQARFKKIPCIKRAEMLGQLMLKNRGIAVAGTHGKTTTTSMIGHLLVANNYDPTVIVGGKMADSHTNALLGKGEYFVTEADEYDRSFLTLYPEISVITSLEEDHMDIYKDMADLKNTFSKFTNQTAFDGLVVLNADDNNTRELADNCVPDICTYAIDQAAEITASDITFEGGKTGFNVWQKGVDLGRIKLNIPGRHNISNALAAISVGLNIGIPFTGIKNSLQSFNGVQRRFEFKGQVNKILFFDDYAHHPTEVKAAIAAAKSGWENRLLVVFQPHLFSRTRDFYKAFADSLNGADKVILAPIYPARESEISGVSSSLIANEMRSNCTLVQDKNFIKDAIIAEIKSGDLLLTMGAGDIWKFGEQVINQLKGGE